jgi:hypothetical protein
MKRGICVAVAASVFIGAMYANAIAESVILRDTTALDAPCANTRGEPVTISARHTGVDAGVSACPRTEVFAKSFVHVLLDTPNFYGALGTDVSIGASFLATHGVQVGFAFRGLSYEYVQNAVIKVSELSYGPLQLHAKASTDWQLAGRPAAAAIYLQATVPLSSSLDTTVTGGQLSSNLTLGLAKSWLLHTRMGLIVGATSSSGGNTFRAAARAGVDVNFHAARWVSLAAGLDVQGGWYRAFDHLMPKITGHFRVSGPWRVESGFAVPLFGSERADLLFSLGGARDL